MPLKSIVILLLGIVLFIPDRALGNEFDTTTAVVISRLNGKIIFDGMPDEEPWKSIEPFPMITNTPVFGKEPTEKTIVRLTFDNEFLYVGAEFYYSDPSKIQITSKKRDEMGAGSDWLGLILDTYDDNQNAVAFFTSPAGLRTDMTISNDANASGGLNSMPMNPSWNTFWDAEVQINDQGWFAEMRIPVSSLRFQDENGVVTMGLILFRWIPYLNEQLCFPAINQDYGDAGPMKPSLAQTIVFHGLTSRKPLYVAPYAITGITQENNLNDEESKYDFTTDKKLEAGLDLKYGITSNLTLDVTVNTDFAQVEADDEMVNLTRFSLFFPEKRQFFLERSSLFDFNTGGPSTMFYSRRIGLDEDDDGYYPVRIFGGVRLVGRQGPWDIGFLNMQTAESENLPSENFGVLRFKRRIVNEYSYVGSIVTSRIGLDGSYNEVYGVDALIRMFGDEYLKIIWGQSFDSDEDNNPFTFDISRYMLNWERKRQSGLYYDVWITGSGSRYIPGIGFEYRENYHGYGGIVGHTWIMDEHSLLMNHGFHVENFNYINQVNGIHETVNISPSYFITTKSYWQGRIGVDYMYENVFEEFELSDDASVPVAKYNFATLDIMFFTPMSKPVYAILMSQTGTYYDGNIVSIFVRPTWSINSSFELSGTYNYNKLNFPGRDQSFESHVARLKVLFMLNTKISASAFVQYNSDIDAVISNFRFRYNPREGNDLYLVYNEGTNTDLHRDTPYLPRMSDRTIVLKYTYTFTF
ncbi:MAG: carbohydrate binding family 9 domain-containing protein [Bacteroidales bacterium]|nr:carbohydrate binding family 9 domain-containing protein [Bacteroidales bacterium]